MVAERRRQGKTQEALALEAYRDQLREMSTGEPQEEEPR